MLKNRDSYMQDLAAVTVIAEASKYWPVSASHLNRLCLEGKLVSTQPDGSNVWVISVRHLVDLFGYPTLPKKCDEPLRDFIAFLR